MTDTPLYRLRDVRKVNGPNFVLEVGDLNILRGETVCLLGPTGAGKSTLLRVLAGLGPTQGGDVLFEDRPLVVKGMPLPLRRRISMVHQRPLLLGGSVASNVEFGLRVRRADQRTPKVAAVLDRLGMGGLASRSARTLSGGQVQLVALARALVIDPDVLLLDEPTAHLDPAHVQLAEEAVHLAQRETGMTVVWATHNLFQARRVAVRVGFLWDGRLVEVAPTDVFFESPTDPRTSDFVQGRMVY